MTKMSSLFISSFLAQTTAPQQQGSVFWSLMPMILLLGAMYFLMIAPQRKKQKEHEKMLASLQTGDEIVTNGGIFGVITNVKEDRFVVRVSENTKLEVGKGFVQSVLKRSGAEKSDKK